jgi:Ca2+-binding RTX toxin-like protein
MSNRREKSTTHDDDVVFGSSEADRINGRRGDDFIDGGAGNDRLSGGKDGDDLFVFGDGEGNDTISDFVAGAGSEDRIDLAAVTLLNNFADVQANVSQVGLNAVIDLGGGNALTLIGVDMLTLHQDDFLFWTRQRPPVSGAFLVAHLKHCHLSSASPLFVPGGRVAWPCSTWDEK